MDNNPERTIPPHLEHKDAKWSADDVPTDLIEEFAGMDIWQLAPSEDHPFLRVIVDPHGGTCKGTHNIVVIYWPKRGDMPGHSQLSWGPNAPLSISGSIDFNRGLALAIVMAEQLRDKGKIDLPAAMRVCVGAMKDR